MNLHEQWRTCSLAFSLAFYCGELWRSFFIQDLLNGAPPSVLNRVANILLSAVADAMKRWYAASLPNNGRSCCCSQSFPTSLRASSPAAPVLAIAVRKADAVARKAAVELAKARAEAEEAAAEAGKGALNSIGCWRRTSKRRRESG